jgi:hypothetical protein
MRWILPVASRPPAAREDGHRRTGRTGLSWRQGRGDYGEDLFCEGGEVDQLVIMEPCCEKLHPEWHPLAVEVTGQGDGRETQ